MLARDRIDVETDAQIRDQLHRLLAVIDEITQNVKQILLTEGDLGQQILEFLIVSVNIGNNVRHRSFSFWLFKSNSGQRNATVLLFVMAVSMVGSASLTSSHRRLQTGSSV